MSFPVAVVIGVFGCLAYLVGSIMMFYLKKSGKWPVVKLSQIKMPVMKKQSASKQIPIVYEKPLAFTSDIDIDNLVAVQPFINLLASLSARKRAVPYDGERAYEQATEEFILELADAISEAKRMLQGEG